MKDSELYLLFGFAMILLIMVLTNDTEAKILQEILK